MLSRLPGAIVRAFFVVLLIATPSLVLPFPDPESAQFVAFMAIFAAWLTLMDYAGSYPSLIEFRDAPPFNRIRFMSLALTILFLSMMARGTVLPSALTDFVWAIGALIGHALDFPYSPVRVFTSMVPLDADPARVELVRAAAGVSYVISLASLIIFVAVLRLQGWPKRNGSFNVWVNLPTFDPTNGGDVVQRLMRDARFNIVLGYFLPFLIPYFVQLASDLFAQISLVSHQTLIWTIAFWAFLPASLFMRGVAMWRIASMIREKRRQWYAEDSKHLQPA